MARLVTKIYPKDHDPSQPIGLSFPLTVGTQGQNYYTTEQVHDNLRNLILTMPGERPMNPSFGSDIYHILFEQLQDDIIQQAAHDAISKAVNTWMPAVKIQEVVVTSQYDDNKVKIEVFYSVNGWKADNVLNLEVKV